MEIIKVAGRPDGEYFKVEPLCPEKSRKGISSECPLLAECTRPILVTQARDGSEADLFISRAAILPQLQQLSCQAGSFLLQGYESGEFPPAVDITYHERELIDTF